MRYEIQAYYTGDEGGEGSEYDGVCEGRGEDEASDEEGEGSLSADEIPAGVCSETRGGLYTLYYIRGLLQQRQGQESADARSDQ